jgi:proton-translocating NADH-quinone oxidoreductase chain L
VTDLKGVLWIIPLLPLAASVLTAALGYRVLKHRSHVPCLVALALSFIYALIVLVDHRIETSRQFEWFAAGDLTIMAVLRSDPLTCVMLVMVTFVSLLVAIYSVGYMHRDPGYPRFFAEIALFVFSMTMLVLSSNFLLLYVFWEAVGLCSYLLIGYWYQRPSAAAAAKKAFLVNRIGDFGFALGIFLIWTTFGSLDYEAVLYGDKLAEIAGTQPGRLLAICLLLFTGAVGKSAQFPLHVWLPDAMEGPSPVSALIHAATMVTAGVYMVARCTPLFAKAPVAQLVVAGIGGITALMAALIALTQNDLKRVLAYSTVSQLGYMFMALGSAAGNVRLATFAVVAAIFHLFTHAFFKALLFLGAGSVMHSMGDVIDMRRFGGLRHALKYTHWTFLIGAATLAGFPLLSGFWSKDEILAALHAGTEGEHSFFFGALLVLAILTAFLTAFYTFRAYFMTFWGEERFPPEAGEHPHESPRVMLVPLFVLAGCSLVVGAIFGPTHLLADFLGKTPGFPPGEASEHSPWVIVLGIVAALAGIGLAWLCYVKQSRLTDKLVESMRSLYELSLNKLYLDEIYQAFLVGPVRVFASICRLVDQYLVDGVVDLIGWTPVFIGRLFRGVQNGLVQFYALAMVLWLTVFVIAMIYRWGN